MYNPRDSYWLRAKKKGYRSRASFKLLELNEKYKLIRNGNRVLDIGAFPGGWMQVALEIVGEKGFIFGVDIEDIKSFNKLNCEFIKADILNTNDIKYLLGRIKNKVDVVISDVAPNTTGIKFTDQVNSLKLSKQAFSLSKLVLKKGGNFLVKVFQSSEVVNFFKEIGKDFNETRITKPEATRKGSAEVYLVGKGFKGSAG